MYIIEIIRGTSSPECLNYWDASLPGLLHSPFGITERERKRQRQRQRQRETEREGKERRKKKEEKVTKHF